MTNDSTNAMIDIDANITATGMDSCLECAGAVDADISLNGEHLAGVSFAPDPSCSERSLRPAGDHLDAWIDNVEAIRDFARSTLSVDEIRAIDEDAECVSDLRASDADDASQHVFDAVIDAISDAVRHAVKA